MEVFERVPDPQRRLDEFGDGLIVHPFDWKAYNKSQTNEKRLFMKFLNDLTKLIDGGITYAGRGRKPQLSSHMVFCMCTKVYECFSARRLISDLEMCKKAGYIQHVPHFNSVLRYFHSQNITKHLKYLLRLSALPLAQLENKFAVDASGIGERIYTPRWSTVRQKCEQHRKYKKIHCICGVHSNVIASCIVTEGNKADSPYFQKLVQEAAENFQMEEVSADMGYLSRDNLKFADDLGISPYIPFKKNTKGNAKGAMIWHKMYKFFKEHPEEFGKHYHLRSNSETVFFQVKKKFGDFVNAKEETAQTNEILCKIICHNICMLIQELFLSDIEIDFNSCAKCFPAPE